MTETALAETGFVAERRYGIARPQVVDGLIAFLREPNIAMYGLDQSLVIRALLYCRPSHRVSYADALIWAAVYGADGDLYTFDRRFPKEGISLLQP